MEIIKESCKFNMSLKVPCPFCAVDLSSASLTKEKHIGKCPALKKNEQLRASVLEVVARCKNGKKHYDVVVAWWNDQRSAAPVRQVVVDDMNPTNNASTDQDEFSMRDVSGEEAEPSTRQTQSGAPTTADPFADFEILIPLLADQARIGQPHRVANITRSQWLYFLIHPSFPGVVKSVTDDRNDRLSRLRSAYSSNDLTHPSSRELVYLRTVYFPVPGNGATAEVQVKNLLQFAGKGIPREAVTNFFRCRPIATGYTEWYRLTHSEVHTLADMFQCTI